MCWFVTSCFESGVQSKEQCALEIGAQAYTNDCEVSFLLTILNCSPAIKMKVHNINPTINDTQRDLKILEVYKISMRGSQFL